MLHTLKLLMPALIPSWRFFDTIGPSPRIEYTLLKTPDEIPMQWQEFRPRPARFSMWLLAKRMVWNPEWNESLFLVSCSERLIANPTTHSQQQITARIMAEFKRHKITASFFRFRLVLVSRQGLELQRQIAYASPAYHAEGGAHP